MGDDLRKDVSQLEVGESFPVPDFPTAIRAGEPHHHHHAAEEHLLCCA